MNVIECYTRERLQQFVLGKLPNDLCDRISQHLDECEICEDTIVGLDQAGDTLIELLANPDTAKLASNSTAMATDQDDEAGGVSSSEPMIEDIPEFQQAVDLIRSQEFPTSFEPIDTIEAPSTGIRIGDYELEEKIASGGMGSVFRARHTRLERSVAIKILPERKMQNAAAIARFAREMKIIGQMDHPTMVSATDAGESNGTHYLVMELIDGLDLARIVRLCGPLSIADACELTRRVALGLEYGHEQGVIHRDVKPSNLMLTRDGNVKILDLGLATLGGLTGTVDELTTVGQLMGTLDYMAPEQCGNEFAIDRRTDVYGLGATLYKLLTGLAPYSNDAVDTPLKKLKAMAIESPTPIQNRRTEIPDELADVVAGCIERHPDVRFATALELADALEPFCQDYDLVNLHERADKISRRTESVDAEVPVQLSQAPSVAAKTYRSVKPSDKTKQTSPSLVRWITAALFLGMASLLAWSGVTIYLDTIAGELVIDSEVDNITVSVIHDEKPAKEISIEQGPTSTKLRAGKYRIEIKGESDGLVIKNDSFELKKGDKVVARISRRARSAETVRKAPDPSVASSLPPTSARSADLSLATSEEIKLELIDLDHAAEVAQLRMELAHWNLQKLNRKKLNGTESMQKMGTARIEYQIAQREYDRAIKKRETTQNIYEKRCESEKESARFKISELRNSIAETEETLATSTKLYREGLASGSPIGSLKRKLKSLGESLEFEQAKFEREFTTPKNGPPRAGLNQLPPSTNKTAAENFRETFGLTKSPRPNPETSNYPNQEEIDWPTYQGTTLPQYVEAQIGQLTRSLGKQGILGYEQAVAELGRKSSPDQVTDLIKQTIKENQQEVSFNAQLGILKSIVPLCTSSEPTSVVFDRMTELVRQSDTDEGDYELIEKLIRLSVLIPENQIPEFEQLLIKLAESGGSKEQYFAIGSLFKHLAKPPVPRAAGYVHIGARTDEKISANWLPVLIAATESDSESLALLASRALAWSWPTELQVLGQFGKLLQSPHTSVKRAAIQVITSQKPTHPDLMKSISAAVDENVVAPVAFVRAIKNPAAAKAIENFMSDPMAGSREITLPAGSGVMSGGFGGGMGMTDTGTIVSGYNMMEIESEGKQGGLVDSSASKSKRFLDWSDRIDLIMALGGHSFDQQERNNRSGAGRSSRVERYGRNTIESGLSRAEASQFLPLLQKELEQASFEKVLNATWASIGYITGEPTPKLYRGRTLADWLNSLEYDDLDPSQHEHGLRAVETLADPFEIGSIVAIAKSFRGDTLDAPVGRNSARSKIAKSKVYEELLRMFKSSSRQLMFVNALDHLDDQDSMFALYVLANLKTVVRSGRGAPDSAILGKSRRYARGLVNSRDPKLRRRALYVASRFPDRNFPSGSDIEAKPIKEILTSASVAMELRLSFLDSLRMYLSPSEVSTLRVFEKTDDPILVSTILTLAADRFMEGQIDRFVLEQLAENRDYLDQSHRPMTLDLWNGPIETKPSPEDSGITIFEKIVNILDSLEPKQLAVYQPRVSGKVTPDSPSYQQKLKAIENLVRRYWTSEGATKRKLERILTTLAPESIDAK